MKILSDVDTLMSDGLQARLDALFAERALAREKLYWTGAGGVVVGLLVGFILFIYGAQQLAVTAALSIMGGGLAWANKIRQKTVNSLKHEMNSALASAWEFDYSVKALPGKEFDHARDFELLPSYENSSFEDQWQGCIDGTNFHLYEARLTETWESEVSRHEVTLFEGIVLRFQFARPFVGVTMLRRENFKFTLFGDSTSLAGYRMERIRMVNPRFENAFDVYGTDQIEGRYLVHPAYCERLIDLENEFAGKNLSALFLHGDLIVTLETGDMFESATLNPDEDREMLGQTIAQFGAIARLIKTLNERARS